MKKHLDVILLAGTVLLAALMLILLCAPGLTETAWGETVHTSLAKLINPENGDLGVGGTIAALIFTLVALCVTIGLLAFNLLKKASGFGGLIALGAAGLLLITGLLFFCTRILYVDWLAKMSGISRDYAVKMTANTALGGGAIANGIFGFLSAALLGAFGVLKIKK